MASKPKSRRSKSNHARFDLSYVRDCANGRWSEILATVGGIPADFLRSESIKSACPKCGGKDRFRFTNLNGGGSILCNQCGRDIGDGFGAIQWFTGRKFAEVLADVAAYLGIEPEAGKAATNGGDPESAKDPTEHLKFEDWSELAAEYFCLFKPGVTPQSLLAVGAKLATYRKQFPVFAIPVWGSALEVAAPVGWTIYHAAGGTLPKFTRGENGEIVTDQVKVKLTAGSKAGISGDLERLRKATTVWKVEGYSDLLTLLSVEGFPADHAAVTNANGCWEKPKPWFVQLLADKKCFVLHDNDVPGQTTAVDEWCPRLGAANVVLPAGDYGKDLRDWVKAGGTWEQLAAMAAAVDPTTKQLIIRHDDDPRRLAEVNEQHYLAECEGVLRYWNDTWYTWKRGRGCYVEIKDYELETKIGNTIQAEFDRIALASRSDDEEEQKPKKVTVALVNNVIRAAKSLSLIPNSVEINSLISTRKKAQYISLKNGILDVAGLLSGSSACFIPHTPDFFSLVCLPYDFNIEATAPTWERTLAENMEWDQERIDILQEWAGYLLLPTTDHQKFLFLEGEGANGKSVYLAGIEAMLGVKNCSHVPLEVFGQQFMLTQTLGKLANIAAECSEMDAIAEGYLKSFTSGDRMSFNRKGIDPIEAEPTARLMLSANMRPRFADRTEGLWRRMLLIPWRTKIEEKRRKRGMDKVTWWEQSGELPGILNWAIEGLIRLNTNGKFTFSKVSDEAMKSYRDEVNPTRQFISEHYMVSTTEKREKCSIVYDHYKEWAFENGYRPVSSNTFGRELSRQLRGVVRERKKDGSDRHYFYLNLERKPDDEELENDDGRHFLQHQSN